MRLIRLHIDNFGILSNFDLTFDENPMVILRNNGWGKSTLAAFIKVMFYGFSGEGKRDPAEREREKYRPWNKGTYGGIIVFSENGREYELNKVFGLKEKEDSCVLCDQETRMNILDRDAAHLGLELFLLDEKSFLRSVFIAQNDVSVYEDGRSEIEDGISAKIGNLSDATDDVNRYEAVMSRFTDLLNKMSPKRATGSIKQMDAHISKLQNTLRKEEGFLQSVTALETKLESERTELRACEERRAVLDRSFKQNAMRGELLARKEAFQHLWKEYEVCRESLEQMETSFANGLPTPEDVDGKREEWSERSSLVGGIENKQLQLEYALKEAKEAIEREKQDAIERKLDEEDARFHKKMRGIVLLCIGAVLLAAGIALGVVFQFLLIGIGVAVASLACLVTGLVIFPFGKIETEEMPQETEPAEEMEPVTEEITAIREEISGMRDRIAIIETQMQEFFWHYSVTYLPDSVEESLYNVKQQIGLYQQKIADVEAKRAAIKEFENANDMTSILKAEQIPAKEAPDDSNERERNEKKIKAALEAIHAYERRLEEAYEKLHEMAETKEELRYCTVKRDLAMHQYDMLTQTKDFMRIAKERFSAKYRKPLLDGFKKYYAMLSDEEASEFQIDANIRMTKREFGEAHPVSEYSSGIQDLVDVCLRMALIDAMYQGEKPFVILDDPFVNLDRSKTERALGFLKKVAKDYQVIYFTCHESRAGT